MVVGATARDNVRRAGVCVCRNMSTLLANDSARPPNERITLDEWLRIVGEFGIYQRRHYFFVHVPGWIASAMVVYLMVFINSAPSWRSADGGPIEHGPVPCDTSSSFNLTSPFLSVLARVALADGVVQEPAALASKEKLGAGSGPIGGERLA